ncbi:MAG TPA: alpha/beta hydrolase [Paraburkholderia sp.]|jgi:proline iminopeptidase
MRATLNGTQIYFDVEGGGLRESEGHLIEKPTLIALHGGLGIDHGYLRPGLGALRDHAQVIYVDLRGQGRSGRPPLASCTLEQMADDLAALCELLEIEHPFVFGHSAGGFVAMHMALRHPRLVRGLILSNSSPSVKPIPDDDGEPAPSFASRASPAALAAAGRLFGGEVTRESVDDFFKEAGPIHAAPSHMHVIDRILSLASMDIEMMQHFMSKIGPSYDLRPRLADIAAPALVISGKWDWVCPPRASRAIARGIPNATLLEVADAGHFVFSEEPEQFLDAVTKFIAVRAS